MKLELAFLLTFYFITNRNILVVQCNNDILLNMPIETIPKDELAIVRHGLILKKINSVVLINENYDFHLRMNFKDFLNLKERVMNIAKERAMSLNKTDERRVSLLTNKIEAKCQEFILSIFSYIEPESNVTRLQSLHDSSFNSINHMYITQEISRLEQVPMNESLQFIHILSNIASEMENDINNFESMFLYSIHTKTLTSSIISPEIFLKALNNEASRDSHLKTHSMIDGSAEGSEYNIYGLSQIAKIYYNSESSSLLFRIRIPLFSDIYSGAEYKVYEIIPVYTWLGLTENSTNVSISNYTMVILDTKDQDKYLAVGLDESDYFTFNDISCRFINVKSQIFCHDSFLHIKTQTEYENCIYSLYKGNGDNELCHYNVVQMKNPTKKFINLGEGRWFYTYSPRKDGIVINQKCTVTGKQYNRNSIPITLEPERGGVGLITFGANCHGSIDGENFVLKSINRKNNLYEFSNFPITISYVGKFKLGSHAMSPREKGVGQESGKRNEVESADDGARLGMSIFGVLLLLPLSVISVYFYSKIKQLEKQGEKVSGNQNNGPKCNTSNVFQRSAGFHTPRDPPSPHPTTSTTNNFSLNPNPQPQAQTKSFNSLLNFDFPHSSYSNGIQRNDSIDSCNKNKSPSLIIDYFDKKRKQSSPATDQYHHHTYINNFRNDTSHTYANIRGNCDTVGERMEQNKGEKLIIGDGKEEENHHEDIIYEDGDSLFENVEKYVEKNAEQKKEDEEEEEEEEKEKSATLATGGKASSSSSSSSSSPSSMAATSVSSLYVDMSLKSEF